MKINRKKILEKVILLEETKCGHYKVSLKFKGLRLSRNTNIGSKLSLSDEYALRVHIYKLVDDLFFSSGSSKNTVSSAIADLNESECLGSYWTLEDNL